MSLERDMLFHMETKDSIQQVGNIEPINLKMLSMRWLTIILVDLVNKKPMKLWKILDLRNLILKNLIAWNIWFGKPMKIKASNKYIMRSKKMRISSHIKLVDTPNKDPRDQGKDITNKINFINLHKLVSNLNLLNSNLHNNHNNNILHSNKHTQYKAINQTCHIKEE